MKVECVYTVLKTAIIEVDDKYKKLISDSDYNLENALCSEAFAAIRQSEKDSVELHEVFQAGTDICLYLYEG